MSTLQSIPSRESILFQKVYPNQDVLFDHLSEYLQEEDSIIFVIQFAGHMPPIQVVGEDLRLLSWIPAFEWGESTRSINPIRLIAVHERDWFLEALGGAAAAFAIYEFIEKRLKGKFPTRKETVKERVRKTRTAYRTETHQIRRTIGRQQQIQNVTQQVPYQETYYEEIEHVKEVRVESVGEVTIREIDEVIRRVRRFEVYDKSEKVQSAKFEQED